MRYSKECLESALVYLLPALKKSLQYMEKDALYDVYPIPSQLQDVAVNTFINKTPSFWEGEYATQVCHEALCELREIGYIEYGDEDIRRQWGD